MKRLDLVSELLSIVGAGSATAAVPPRELRSQSSLRPLPESPSSCSAELVSSGPLPLPVSGGGHVPQGQLLPSGSAVGSHLEDFAAEAAVPKVLLHACCAPCSGAILEALVAAKIPCTVFYSNDNIVPREEYDKRLNECLRYAEKMGVEIVEDPYDHERWLCEVSGLETEPERGRRCQQCFMHRLSRAARYAAEHGFPVLTTTLASSRWKDLEQVNAAGLAACALYPGVTWWPRNWRKDGLQERRSEIIREQQFYNQLWCGCEFSQREPSLPRN